jgi:hypothetical protein
MDDSVGIGYATQPIGENKEIDALLDSTRLADISARDRKRLQPRHSNQLNNSLNFSELRQVKYTQKNTKL